MLISGRIRQALPCTLHQDRRPLWEGACRGQRSRSLAGLSARVPTLVFLFPTVALTSRSPARPAAGGQRGGHTPDTCPCCPLRLAEGFVPRFTGGLVERLHLPRHCRTVSVFRCFCQLLKGIPPQELKSAMNTGPSQVGGPGSCQKGSRAR